MFKYFSLAVLIGLIMIIPSSFMIFSCTGDDDDDTEPTSTPTAVNTATATATSTPSPTFTPTQTATPAACSFQSVFIDGEPYTDTIFTSENYHTMEFDFVDGSYWDAEPEYFTPDYCVGSITPSHGNGSGHYTVEINVGGISNPYCQTHYYRDFYFYGSSAGGDCQLTITFRVVP